MSSSVADFGKQMAPRIVTSYGLDGPGLKPQWGSEIFCTHPDQPAGQPSLLYNKQCSFISGCERGSKVVVA